MAKVTDPKDPRFRRFRTATYGVYLLVVGAFSLLVTFSIIRSVREMSPRRPVDTDQVLTVRECVDRAKALWERLDDERKNFTDTHPAEGVDEQYSRFRVEWLRQMRELEGLCAVDSRQRTALRKVFRRLDVLQDLYTTHAVQYAGEVGPAVDRLETALTEARKEAAE